MSQSEGCEFSDLWTCVSMVTSSHFTSSSLTMALMSFLYIGHFSPFLEVMPVGSLAMSVFLSKAFLLLGSAGRLVVNSSGMFRNAGSGGKGGGRGVEGICAGYKHNFSFYHNNMKSLSYPNCPLHSPPPHTHSSLFVII